MSHAITVVLVGHCWPDRLKLKSAVRGALGRVRIARANDMRALQRGLGSKPLLLVNRVLDGRFETGSGVGLIRELHQRRELPAALLISDHDDAQAEAVAAGALPGFGKSKLRDATTAEILREAAGTASR